MTERTPREELAIKIGLDYGGTDGAHHKMWVIDQMLRALLEDGYQKAIAESCDGEDGPETYEWDTGVAP